MNSQSLKEMVKTISQDEQVRARFQSDPESVMSRFGLTDPEKRAVLNAYAKHGLRFTGTSKLDGTVGPLNWWY